MTTLRINSAKKTLIASAILLSQSMYLAPLPVLADTTVRIAGQSVFNVTANSAATTADKRAETVQNNLDNALVAAKDRTPSAVNITYVKGFPVITLGGYQIVTIDAATAKSANSSPAVLAKKWADSIRDQLRDQASIDAYVQQLSGDYTSSAPAVTTRSAPQNAAPVAENNYQPQPQYNPSAVNATYNGSTNYNAIPPYQGGMQQGGQMMQGGMQQGMPQGAYRQGRVSYAPAGLTMPISLQTSISTQVAKAGDMIQANISQTMYLGDSTIPAGSVVVGTITDSDPGRRLSRSGKLSIKFNRLRTPDGVETPITAHLVGGIDKYTDVGNDQSDTMRGEGWKAKVGQTAIRGGVGAGAGAALGTALGAIAGRSGTAVGRGAWGGAAIGGGVGAASMLLRKGRDVVIPSGTQMQLQLDAPAAVAGGGNAAVGGMVGGNL
jgi:hypothetical protein